jgi:hypothetical protein
MSWSGCLQMTSSARLVDTIVPLAVNPHNADADG